MSRRIRPAVPPPKVLGYAALVGLGAAVLAACGHSAPTRFFTLDPVAPAAPAAAAAYAGPPLKVLAVNIPPALDREELVSEGAGGEVRVHDFEHWEAPLGQTARQVLIQDLAGRMPAGAVLGPAAPGGEGMAALSVDVVAFHAGPEGTTLQAGWSVSLPGRPGAPGPLVWRAPLVQLQGTAAGEGGSGTAQAFSALLGQLADRIAATLPAEAARLQAEQALAVERAQVQALEAARAARPRTPTTTTTHTRTTTVHAQP
jgi:uncharacterized protein